MILVSSLLFIQCTSDPIAGPQGIAGIDGVDGVDGINGQDGSDAEASCIACHSNSNRDPIHTSYAMSGHAAGGAVGYAGGRSGCAQCHSNEGYIDYMETGATNPDGYTGQGVIGCTTCHSKHSTFDFENDGHDYALRDFEPVELIIGSTLDNPSGIIDYEGTSNNCAFCHQPRRTPPTDDGSGIFNITSSHYGPHYGAQTTMLEGIQGANIPGSVEYPAPGTATHRTSASCVSCHMGEPNADDGAHTFNPSINSCTSCHTSLTELDYHGVQTEVDELMAELKTLLTANGVFDAEGNLITGEHPVGLANAFWNWKFIYQDHSHGVHNPKYTLALLKNSIEYLENLD